MFLFFLYMSYERRYCNAKFESENLLLRNVVVMIIIIIINVIVARSCVVRLQFLTQEVLAITSEYMYISYIARSWFSDRDWGRKRNRAMRSRDFTASFPIRYIPTRTSIRLLKITLIYHTLFFIHRRETTEILGIEKILCIEIFPKLPF